MRTQITTEKCGECHGPYALGIKMGNMIFTTQIGTDSTGEIVEGGIKEQTKATMENAKAVLEAADASMDDVAKVTIYISDIYLIPEMNEVYNTYFPEGDYPARCCTQCVKMVDGCLVEMEFTAMIV
ncbi:MAG: RidA family protein [Lachnospiraceae bacterium]